MTRTLKGKRTKVSYKSKWKNLIGIAILDEGHKLRHWYIKMFAAVKGLAATVHWFITATPVVNSPLVGVHAFVPV